MEKVNKIDKFLYKPTKQQRQDIQINTIRKENGHKNRHLENTDNNDIH